MTIPPKRESKRAPMDAFAYIFLFILYFEQSSIGLKLSAPMSESLSHTRRPSGWLHPYALGLSSCADFIASCEDVISFENLQAGIRRSYNSSSSAYVRPIVSGTVNHTSTVKSAARGPKKKPIFAPQPAYCGDNIRGTV
jgi:hypothetical protein